MLHELRRARGYAVVVSALVLLLSWPLPAATTFAKPEQVGLSSERLARIGQLIDRQIESGYLSGAVALVARRGQVAYLESRGISDIQRKKPMRKDSLFRIASMSKPITAVAILMLVEEGKVRLTDPVSRFIPEFKSLQVAVQAGPSGGAPTDPQFMTVPAEREITIRDLLTHTSGLMSGGISSKVAARQPRKPEETLADYIPRLAVVPLAFQPGTRWSYSPLGGFDTLGRVVEVASGQTFDRFLKNRLFDALGMTSTAFTVRRDRADLLATIHRRTPNGLQIFANQSQLTSDTYFSGAGGLVSSAEDYLQFAQMLLERGVINGRRILSPTTVSLMTGIHVPDSVPGAPRGRAFGLAVQVITDPFPEGFRVSEGSFGWAGAYCTFFWVNPREKLVSIFMTQSEPFSQDPSRDFENAVMQAIIE